MAKKMGRPLTKIDKSQFEKLCSIQCTKEEIAGFFDCSEDTIEKFCKREYGETFTVVFKQKRQAGKISLRRSQWKLAEKNVTMAIWLGKQYLGQKEQQEVRISHTDDDTIKEMQSYFESRKEKDNGQA